MKNKYSLSSKLILITFLIGIVNLFLHDYESTQESLVLILILILRYLLFILIKRRFEWSIYLLVFIIFRSIHRLFVVFSDVDTSQITKINLILQLVMTVMAFAVLFIFPKMKDWMNNRRKYFSPTTVTNPQH